MIGPFFYDKAMSVQGVDSFSPSAGKPARFMELMEIHYRRTPVMPVKPATKRDLYAVHDREFVEAIFNGEIPNGFGNTDKRVPEACLWTCGAMATAALYAPHDCMPVCVPASGFHHAGYNFAEGYCTFNGLMVAASVFMRENPGARIAILDCDMHYGNGTDDILRVSPARNAYVMNMTSGKHFSPGDSAWEFFLWLDEAILEINEFKPDLVLYQAGADMSIHDPLGGLLTDEEMQRRDIRVFKGLKYPMVWNLAGGYQPGSDINTDPVLKLHRQTVAASNMSDKTRFDIKTKEFK